MSLEPMFGPFEAVFEKGELEPGYLELARALDAALARVARSGAAHAYRGIAT